MQIKLSGLIYSGMWLVYCGLVLFLVTMNAETGLADNVTVDKSELISSITSASAKLGSAVAGIEPGQYPQSAINAFDAAITKAEAVADDSSATQAEVNQAVKDLRAAEAIFDTAKITTVNKAALTSALTTAASKAESAVAGIEPGQYPQSAITAFNAAISTAWEVANDASATQANVDKAVTDLKAAEAIFDAAKITTVNKGVLIASITAANIKAGSAVAGTGNGQYPQSAIDTFNAAIATAQSVADNPYVTQNQVNLAVTDLKEAEAIFDASKITTWDLTPPASVTNLRETGVGPSWIRWTWTNPNDADFSHVMVYIDGKFVTDTSTNFYIASGLPEGTSHIISIQTIDAYGNINSTLVADSATTTTVNVDLVSHFGGSINDVAISGDYAYLGQGQDFVVLDIADVDKPSEAGRIVTPSVVIGVTVSGNYAYVADGSSGLIIIDITNPSSPTIAGGYDTAGHAYGIVVSGNYAYVADTEDGLVIVDISNPSTPTLAGSYDTGIYANDVAVAGNYAYVADYDNGLVIVDITNPVAPTLTSNYNTAGHAYGIVVSGNYAYVADAEDGLVILDITNPSTPTLAGSYDTSSYANDVDVSGNYAYVANSGRGLVIVDISNPSSLTLVGTYYTDYAHAVAVSGNYVYVAAGSNYIAAGYNGLVIVDITNPSSPALAGNYDTAGYAWVVDVSGNYAYLASGGSDYVLLSIVDVTYTSSPTLAGSYSLYADNGIGVTVSGNYAYIGVGFPGLSILDISNPTSPRHVGGYGEFGPLNHTTVVVVSGNYAYVPKENGLEILDISDPSSPIFVGRYDTAGSAGAVDVSGNYAYVADENGLSIVDINDKSTPTFVGSYDTAGYVSGVAVSGNYAYVTSTVYLANAYQSHFEIVDITNPSSPALAGNYGTAGYAWVVDVSGNYAYVADENGLSIVDINDKSTPTFVGSYDTAGYVSDVAISGNYAYVAAGENGLVILRVETASDTTPPAPVTNLREIGVGPSWIRWTWTNPADTDFKHVIVYIDGRFVVNTSNEFYNATGLASGTTHIISTRTVDTSNNINTALVNDSATTTNVSQTDTTPPVSVTNLNEIGVSSSWIKWTWVNSKDVDFKHVMVYLDGAFVMNTSDGFYNATGLEGVYIIDLNLNDEWVKIKNSGSSTVDLTDWMIKDEDDIHTFTFPSFQLKAGATVTIYTSEGSNTETELYWGSGGSVWNNEGDTAYLYNSNGNPVDSLNSRTTHIIEGRTHTINTRTVDTSGNLNATWVNDSATTTVLMISGLSGKDITASSITLTWTNSPDISIVEIYRNNGIVGNVTGFTSYVDSNLNSATSYNYTLIPYNINGLQGKAVSISLKTASASSGGGGGGGSTSKKSSGGGGGGAGSAEDYANVAIKDVDSEYLRMNANVIYEFTREGNPIQSVSFYSLKNSGQITSTIEVLNNRSKLVSSGPEGLVYKYVNIWVGKSGFSTAANIKDARVKFKVSNLWIKDMGVSLTDVKLQRYNGTAWEVLPTTMDSNTTGYTMFEARTPGFSPFAITAERAVVASVTGETGTTPIQTENVGVEGTQPEKSRIWTFVLAVLIIGVFAVGYEYLKRRQN